MFACFIPGSRAFWRAANPNRALSPPCREWQDVRLYVGSLGHSKQTHSTTMGRSQAAPKSGRRRKESLEKPPSLPPRRSHAEPWEKAGRLKRGKLCSAARFWHFFGQEANVEPLLVRRVLPRQVAQSRIRR